MIDPSLRRRMKELEIRSLRLVNGRFMGEWASNMRGQGLEFRDLREYVPGDDVRRLDWKATARSGRPQLRQFIEDRQQSIWFALDLSASMDGRKAELARQILAVLGWAAVKQNDRFALMGFTDRIEIHQPPSRGEARLWAAVDAVLEHKRESKQTAFAPVWEFFLKRLTGRATIILLSDFSAGLDTRMLRALAARHEVLAFQLIDPREDGRPDGGRQTTGGLASFEDSETGERVWADLSPAGAAAKLYGANEAARQAVRKDLRKAGVWYSSFAVDKDFLPPLMEFFHRRMEVLGA